jgi:polyketide biosynthesis acyl carrier protein
MNQEAIFAVVKRHVLAVIPSLQPADITPERSLKELGANSIDRIEVATYSMEEFRVKVPAQEVASATTLGDLVALLQRHLH